MDFVTTSVVIILLSVPHCVYSSFATYSCFSRIPLPAGVTGPHSVAFDPRGEGPYVGVDDGRVLKWQGPAQGFVDFATTSSNRSKEVCDGAASDPNIGATCGRPLGLSFNSRTGHLYIADGYLGLQIVGPKGGLATVVATSAEGISFRFVDGVDVDQRTGLVYFSSVSTNYDLRNLSQQGFVASEDDASGRLLKYDPRTKKVRVLLRGISSAVGVAVSYDSSFVLVSEFARKRILRYWLTGPKANSAAAEVFLKLPGNPIIITKDYSHNFWVAVNLINTTTFTPLGIRLYTNTIHLKRFEPSGGGLFHIWMPPSTGFKM